MSDVEIIAGLDHLGAPRRSPSGPRAGVSSAIDRRLKVTAAFAAGDAVASMGVLAILALCFEAAGRPRLALGPSTVLGTTVLLVCLGLLFGLYDTGRSSPIELFRQRVRASSIFCAFLVAILGGQIWAPDGILSWLVLVPSTVVLGSLTAGLVQFALKRLGLWQTRVVLIGDAAATRGLSLVLDAHPGLGLRVLARVAADDPRLAEPSGFEGQRAEMAVLMSSGDGREDARTAARLNFPSVVVARDAGDMQTLWSNTRMIGSAVGIEIRRSPVRHDLLLKRGIDLAVGCCLLVFALPVVAAVAFAIWCVDRRNPFYAQPRIGLDGRVVRVWKVRSMFADAEARLEAHLAGDAGARAEWNASYKLRHDPRILPGIGQFIRRSSLDELPQLWNVVRGDMSLVGPRPFPAYHLKGFDEGFQALRASVTPGLTGFWQITARSDGDLVVQQNADTFYIRNWSIWMDLYILLHTLPAVLFGKGAR